MASAYGSYSSTGFAPYPSETGCAMLSGGSIKALDALSYTDGAGKSFSITSNV